jgi:hypothetical protein
MDKCLNCSGVYDIEYSRKVQLTPFRLLSEMKIAIDWKILSDASDYESFCNRFCEKKWRDINEPVQIEGGKVYIEKTEPFFNRGLGCVTNGTRHAEKIAKSRGFTAIGNDTLSADKITAQRSRSEEKRITALMTEGIKAMRAGKTLEGKPLKLAMRERK